MSRQITKDEFFTPFEFVQEVFKLEHPNQIFIDHNAGQFVWGIVALEYKMGKGIDRETALDQIYMAELFEDNCIQGIKNLYGEGDIEVLKGDNIPENLKGSGLIAMFKHNDKLIPNCVQADALKYTWNFGNSNKMSEVSGLFPGLYD